MSIFSFLFIPAGVCALIATVYAYFATTDPEMETKNAQMQAGGTMDALEQMQVAQFKKKAAIWGAAAAILGLLAWMI